MRNEAEQQRDEVRRNVREMMAGPTLLERVLAVADRDQQVPDNAGTVLAAKRKAQAAIMREREPEVRHRICQILGKSGLSPLDTHDRMPPQPALPDEQSAAALRCPEPPVL